MERGEGRTCTWPQMSSKCAGSCGITRSTGRATLVSSDAHAAPKGPEKKLLLTAGLARARARGACGLAWTRGGTSARVSRRGSLGHACARWRHSASFSRPRRSPRARRLRVARGRRERCAGGAGVASAPEGSRVQVSSIGDHARAPRPRSRRERQASPESQRASPRSFLPLLARLPLASRAHWWVPRGAGGVSTRQGRHRQRRRLATVQCGDPCTQPWRVRRSTRRPAPPSACTHERPRRAMRLQRRH